LVRVAHIAAGGKFSTREIRAFTAEAMRMSVENLQSGILRYDLSKLRAEQLLQKVPPV